MDNAGKTAIMRLKRVLLNDKTLPNGLLSVLRADMLTALQSYFDFDASELIIDIDLDAQGKYFVKITAPVDRVKNLNII